MYKYIRRYSTIQSVKGMRDFFGEDMIKFKQIQNIANNIFTKYGYEEIMTNIVEYRELFDRSLGETSDIIQKEMYQITDLAERNLVLRPEGTASVARAFIEKSMNKTTLPKKFHYCGPMFRYEKPQKGRYRQFYQIGVEYIGNQDELADVELLLMANEFLKCVNPMDYKIEINTLGDIESRKNYSKALNEYFSHPAHYEKLSELSKLRLKNDHTLRILDSKEKSDISLLDKCPKIHEFLTTRSKSRYEKIKRALNDLNLAYIENPNLVRGLDYYNDLCFEIKAQNTIDQKNDLPKDTLLGGGRYDTLIDQLQGKQFNENSSIPAVGFAAGVDRLMLIINENVNIPKKIKVGIIHVSEKEDEETKYKIKLETLKLIQKFKHLEEFEFESIYHLKKIDKQFQYLNKKHADVAIIIGSTELNENQMKLKNLHTEEQMTIENSVNLLNYLEFFKKTKQ